MFAKSVLCAHILVRSMQRRSEAVATASSILQKVCETTCQMAGLVYETVDEFVNRISRPKWNCTEGFEPYAVRSYDIGDHEYEVIICRRKLSLCSKVADTIRRETRVRASVASND